MRSNSRLLVIILVVVVVVFAGLMLAKKSGMIGGEKSKEVQIAKAARVTITERVNASGKVQPVDEVKLSPDVSGEIREILVKEGDSVTVGQLLLKIRPDNFRSALERSVASLNTQRANLAQAKARLAQTKARFVQAEQDYQRNQSLFEKKVISTQEWETIRSNYEASKADLDASEQSVEAARYTVLSAEATVKEANENLSLTSIHAPMSGIITKLSVEKGERVVGTQQMTGTEMLRIANLNAMEVRVNVNENDIIRVSKGDTAVIDVDAYTYKGVKFKGRVVAIANSANESAGISESVTEFEVRIIIDPASYMPLMKEQGFFPFRPGMTASVDIITEERSQVLSVPLAAVTTRSPKSDKGPGRGEKPQGDEKAKPDEEVKEVVFVVRADTVAMVTVTTGISDFDHIEVLSGIEEGMEVVEGPFIMVSRMLEDGDKVKPMGAAGKPKAE